MQDEASAASVDDDGSLTADEVVALLQAESRVVAVRPWMVEVVGAAAALWFSQLLWRMDVEQTSEIVAADSEWGDATGLSSDQVFRVRKRLVEVEWITCERRRVNGNPTTHVTLNVRGVALAATTQSRYRDNRRRDSAIAASIPDLERSATDVARAAAALAESLGLSWKIPTVVIESGRLVEAVDLCTYMAAQLDGRGYPSTAKAKSKRWVLDMEALLRLDGRTADQIRFVLDWLNRGDDEVSYFWRTNILSPGKLREKLPRLREQFNRLDTKPKRDRGENFGMTRADVDARMAAARSGHTPADADALPSQPGRRAIEAGSREPQETS